MQKINCNVNNCSHYNSGFCYAERVNIGGDGTSDKDETCCGSFLDSKLYSKLTSCETFNNCGTALVCKATGCVHNKNRLCTLDSIQVSGGPVNMYTETYCASFEK